MMVGGRLGGLLLYLGTSRAEARWRDMPEKTPLEKETYDPHRSTTEVRAGDRRQMNLRVLVISFVAIVILLAIIYSFFYPIGPPHG